jgi:hypothetical protein
MTSALSLSVGLSLSLFPPVHLAVQAGDLVSPVWAYLRDGGYGSDWVRGVAFDSQGVLAAAGMIRSTNSPNYGDAACLMRFGTPGWTHVVDLGPYQQNVRDEVNDRFHDVATDSQDNVVVVGNKSGAYYGAEGYHVAAMLRKYSPTGTLLWEKVQSFGAWSSGYGVCLDASDNIYVAGAVFANWTIEEGQWAIWKYDPGGTLQTGFPIYYNYSSGSGAYQYQDIAFDIAVDGAGGFLVVGRRGVAVGNVDWHVRKYDASRALVWQDTYSGPADGVDDAYRAVADSEGNFVVAGYTIKAASDYDWLVIKYRGSDGQRLWTRTYESAGGRSEACYGVAVDGLDNALVGGGEVGTDGKTHWRLEHLAKADGQLLAAQVWPSDQDEVLYAVAYRDRQIALGGSQSNGTNTDLRIITGLFGASLRVEPRTLDLGTVTAGSTAEQTVTITNVSAQSVTLGTIGAGDPLAAPFVMVADDCSGKTFAPGAGGTVTVAFRPTVAGRFTDSFDVPQAPPSSESYSVGVSGRGVEPATLASETFAYVRDGGQGSDWIRGVALDRQGVLAAVGALRTTANYGDAACVMRFGSPGWTNVLDLGPVQAGVRDEVNDRFQDVATDSQDNVVVVGNKSGAYYGAEGYHVAAMLRKYSPTGTLLWEKVQSFGAWSSAYGVSLDANDNIYVAGSVFANWTIEEGQWAIWKYDPAGALQTGFPIYYNFSSGSGAYQYQDIAFDLAVDGAAGFLVVGRRGVGVGNVIGTCASMTPAGRWCGRIPTRGQPMGWTMPTRWRRTARVTSWWRATRSRPRATTTGW